jgi:Golgi SNAP receptor complex protein 1
MGVQFTCLAAKRPATVRESGMSAARAELFRSLPSRPASHLDDRFDILAAEHESIRNSSDLVDSAIDLGIATNERLITQGQMLAHSTSNMQQIIGKMPILGGLAAKVNVKRRRDRLILGTVIGVLAFILFWYMFG